MNRLMSANKNGFRRESHQDETVEDRMRIFEDEIIKRIKVIQSFVKTLDGKVKRMQANQKGNQESHRKSHQISSRHGTSIDDSNVMDDRRPERLRDVLDDQAPLGANQQIIKEAIKWELEIIERKSEDRFREIEGLIKRLGVKVDQNSASLQEETSNEFQSIKIQFEDFGNTIYERINTEVHDKISFELSKSLMVL